MNKITLFILAILLFVSCKQKKIAAVNIVEDTVKPNIILIFTDDQGYGDLGCYGSPNIETPNIDLMASEGIRLTSFYAAAVCGPSRAQLMTGSYHPRVSHSFNELPESKLGLHSDEITIAEVLKKSDYKTMHIGKWHLGDAPEFLPTKQGFDTFFGFPYSHDMWPYHCNTVAEGLKDTVLMKSIRDRKAEVGYTVGGSWDFPDLPLMEDDEVIELNPDQNQMTRRYTEKALDFIEENHNEPFFLYLAHTMPHTNLFVSEDYKGRSERGQYGDVIMEVDWSTGEILKKLKKLGIDDNTLIVFTSDNGPTPKYGSDGGSAGLLRGAKGSMYEGGLRVPAIFRWPGTIPAGKRSNAMTSTIDLLPTFAYLGGVKIPDDRVIDGDNLLPLLKGENLESPHQFIHYFAGSRHDKASNYKAIRNNNWKLFFKRDKSREFIASELYLINEDPSEKYNKINQHPEIVNSLLKKANNFYLDLENNKRPIGKIN